MRIKENIQKYLKKHGVLLRRFREIDSEINIVVRAAHRAGTRVVFDVGANKGQFASECWEVGFNGIVVSFEPQSKAHAELVRRAATTEGWVIAPRMCVGERDGEATIHISPNSTSSSLLSVTHASIEANKDTVFVADEEVTISRLDSVADAFLLPNDRLMLKIDTQGYEGAVLAGASQLMPRVDAIYLEMSLTEVYEGAPSFVDLYSQIENLGFRCIGLFQGFTNPYSLEVLQVNGLFVRRQIC